MTVEICKSQKEVNSAFSRADDANCPHFWIKTRQKYAHLEVDMITTDGFMLAKEQLDRITDIFDDYCKRAYEDPDHKQTPVYVGRGQAVVSIHPLRIPVAKEAAKDIEQIVLDEESWVPRGRDGNVRETPLENSPDSDDSKLDVW
ncbi:hypothetical protein NKF06_19160 [Haloferax sp. AB510]|uniref:hypothetical protein n=1 Tax=Haloferax sp. AB510 TaxID=2934172 RepID=UPI00209C61C6|nr:hypothetical protein [Haloferax sp. AB510]MCO8268640.1 hypothetical protein [Haloferax sp. AB510]